jgi:hypothetical protein
LSFQREWRSLGENIENRSGHSPRIDSLAAHGLS